MLFERTLPRARGLVVPVRAIVPTLLALSAGAAQAQTYTGAGANNNWSTAANWNAQPAAGGSTTTNILMGAGTPVARASTNQNHGNPFVLESLTFEIGGPTFSIAGDGLKFDTNGATFLTNNSNRVHIISAPITLASSIDLTLSGAANSTSQVRLQGVIGGAMNNGLRLDIAGASSFSLEAANTFGGGVVVDRGRLAIGDNGALGTGQLTMNGGTVRSGAALDAVVTNPLTIGGSFQVGETGVNRTLSINGPVTTSGNRTITLPNALAGLRLGGAVTAGAMDTLNIMGGTAPTFGRMMNRGPLVLTSTGSHVLLPANSAAFEGTLNVVGATVDITGGTLGSAAKPCKAVNIGDGTVRSAMIAKATSVVLPVGQNISVKSGNNRDRAVLQLGKSPGTLSVGGGGVLMEPGSDLALSIDGFTPGNDDGFHSQMILHDGSLILQSIPGMRPVLNVGLGAAFNPLPGSMFEIVSVRNSSITAMDLTGNLFMSPDGLTLGHGSIWTADDGVTWQIGYRGFSGFDNDVILTMVNLPAPAAGALLGLGMIVAARRRRR